MATNPEAVKWLNYMRGLQRIYGGGFSSDHVLLALNIWGVLSLKFKSKLPIPATQPTVDGGIQYWWGSGDQHLEVSIYSDGTIDWFYRNRKTNELKGTEDIKDEDVSMELINCITEFLSNEG